MYGTQKGASSPRRSNSLSGMEMMMRMMNTAEVSLEEQRPLILQAQKDIEPRTRVIIPKRSVSYERLYGSVFRYIRQVAFTVCKKRPELEPEDFVAESHSAVVHAIVKFDVTKGIRFLTYSGWWIRQYLRRYAEAQGLVHQPSHRYNRKTSRDEAHLMDKMIRLDCESASESGSTFGEVMAVKLGMAVDDVRATDARTMMAAILSASALLPTRERFAFESTVNDDMTLQEAGELIELTRERVRQLRMKAEWKIGAYLQAATRFRAEGRPGFIKQIWLPEHSDVCIEENCGRSNRPFIQQTDGTLLPWGGAFRCRPCFLDFAYDARLSDE